MRKRMNAIDIAVLVCIAILLVSVIIGMTLPVYADSPHEEPVEYISMEATAYCYGTTRCDGQPVRTGICAGKPEWYGKVAAIYYDDGGKPGEFIGYFEIKDTGGDERIRDGTVLDIHIPDYNECIKFGRQKVLVALIDGEG